MGGAVENGYEDIFRLFQFCIGDGKFLGLFLDIFEIENILLDGPSLLLVELRVGMIH
jgi:hypothetical protein